MDIFKSIHSLLQTNPAGEVIFYAIVILMAVALWLFAHRFFYLVKVHHDYEDFMNGMRNRLQTLTGASLREAVALCDEVRMPLASIARGVLTCGKRDVASLREAADEVAMEEIPRLQRNARLIAGIGQLAPFLGLLGSIATLFQGFQFLGSKTDLSLNLHSMGDVFAVVFLLMGISVGLSMLVVLFNLILSEKVHSVMYDMEKASHEMIALLTDAGNARDLNQEMIAGEGAK